VEARTLGELKATYPEARRLRPVKAEIRANLAERLARSERLFPGIHGYQETVIPALATAILAGHDLVFLGTRGQAKSRLTRMLATLLDERVPALPTPMRDDPFAPVSPEGKRLVRELGDQAPIVWLTREERYLEKLATPDVTVADLIGDLDPIKAARRGRGLSDLEAMHYGLLPRANRGIFAIQELPDLAPKVQVALFNVLEEGDVQIRGFPVRLPLDVWLVFTANPEDYTARGRIVTPLKDRIEAEIRTHYPRSLEDGLAITRQEADLPQGVRIPEPLWRAVERVAFLAREDPRVEPASGVSQRLPIALAEAVAAGAFRRHLVYRDPPVARPHDFFTALFAITGKLELTYEGEALGAEAVAASLVARAFLAECRTGALAGVRAWFESGAVLEVPEGPFAAVKAALDRLPELRQGLAGGDAPTLYALAEARLVALVGEGFLVREAGGYRRA